MYVDTVETKDQRQYDLNAMYVNTVKMKRKYTKLHYICLFIYYVDTVDTTFTEYTRFNGTYVDTVDTIELKLL